MRGEDECARVRVLNEFNRIALERQGWVDNAREEHKMGEVKRGTMPPFSRDPRESKAPTGHRPEKREGLLSCLGF